MPDIIMVTLKEPTYKKPDNGFVRPIGVISSGQIKIFSEDEAKREFPTPGLIFVSQGYQELENNYGYGALFTASITSNYNYGDKPGLMDCEYLFGANYAKARPEGDFIDIIDVDYFDNKLRSKEDIRYRPGHMVLLRDVKAGFMYGPVKCIAKDNPSGQKYYGFQKYNLTFNSYSGSPGPNKLPEDIILRFNLDDIPTEMLLNISDGELWGNRWLLTSWEELVKKAGYELVDYMEDNSLAKWYNELPKEQRLSREQVRWLRDTIIDYQTNVPFLEERKQRLITLLEEGFGAFIDLRNSMIQEYLATNEGTKYLDKYAERHKTQLLKKRMDEIDAKAREEYEPQKRNYEEEINRLKKDLQEIKNQYEKTSEELKEKNLSNIKEEVSSLEKRKQELITGIESLEERIEFTTDIETLKRERARVGFLKEELEKEVASLKTQINTLNSDFEHRLSEIKPLVNFLVNGVDMDNKNTNESGLITASTCRNDIPKADEFVDEIIRYFRSGQRKATREMVVNLLVSISQSYLTILTGLPGVGKTSTVKLVAQAMGLSGYDDINRFLEVAVARGWSSSRDLIGYYNPLNHIFEPAPTGMFDVIKIIDQEAESYESNPPIWVLLDEANLSPVEHYWSNFSALADTRKNIMKLGENYQVTDALRFIATVNMDSTTEPLSDRLLDRAHVILVEPENDIITETSDEELYDCLAPLSCKVLNDYFGPPQSNSNEFTDAEKDVFKDIQDILQDESKGGRPSIISPRTQQSILYYCTVARELMPTEKPLCALDYAVSQKILPRLTGYDNFLFRLEELQSKIREDLPRSARILEHMIRIGREDHGFYRFFY